MKLKGQALYTDKEDRLSGANAKYPNKRYYDIFMLDGKTIFKAGVPEALIPFCETLQQLTKIDIEIDVVQGQYPRYNLVDVKLSK
jgi:hypothetical protein